jgi:hypothetical protein
MRETIYYVSDFKYFSRLTSDSYKSKRGMVKAHIDYIKNQAEATIGDYKRILDNVELVNKRVNSRVAMSFVIAIPNDLTMEEIEEWLEEIRDFISEFFNIDKEDIFIAYHSGENSISGKKNKHFHIVLTPRTREGKPLRLKKQDLKEFHKKLQNYIEGKGFKIRRDKKDDKQEHLGTRLRYDKELREAYLEYLKLKEEKANIEKEIQKAKRLSRETKEKEIDIKGILNIIEMFIDKKREVEGKNKISRAEIKLEKITLYKPFKLPQMNIRIGGIKNVKKDKEYRIIETIRGITNSIRNFTRREHQVEGRKFKIRNFEPAVEGAIKVAKISINKDLGSISREREEYRKVIKRYRESIEQLKGLKKDKYLRNNIEELIRELEEGQRRFKYGNSQEMLEGIIKELENAKSIKELKELYEFIKSITEEKELSINQKRKRRKHKF